MRQEVHLSVHRGTAPPGLAEHCGVPRTLERADNYGWTRRILAHLEDVTRFVYGAQTRSPGAWDALKGYLDAWRQERPQAFDPIWYSGDETVEFPEMWFANDCHGTLMSIICGEHGLPTIRSGWPAVLRHM